VFAPVGAQLARGTQASEVGPELSALVPSVNSPVKRVGSDFEGQVVAVDHFGNCITNLCVSRLCAEAQAHPERYQVCVDQRELRLARTYSDVAAGELCALVSSFGTIEIAARDGNAAWQLSGGRGASEAALDSHLGRLVRLCRR